MSSVFKNDSYRVLRREIIVKRVYLGLPEESLRINLSRLAGDLAYEIKASKLLAARLRISYEKKFEAIKERLTTDECDCVRWHLSQLSLAWQNANLATVIISDTLGKFSEDLDVDAFKAYIYQHTHTLQQLDTAIKSLSTYFDKLNAEPGSE